MNIGRKDVIWNYAATFLKIGVGVILLPFILRSFSQETVAIWSIFTTVITLTGLFDFGFNSSFARNVTYVVSGVKALKATGLNTVESGNNEIDYGLFKGLIAAMKWFYARMAAILFLILSTVGTYYIHTILKTYSGNHTEVYIAWGALCIINSYSLYTMYYDSLMQGRGLIKRAKQIDVFAYSTYLITAATLILCHFNLIAIVSAQVLQVLCKRFLSYRTIFTAEFKQHLHTAKAGQRRMLLKLIYSNALKVGLNLVGWNFISRSSMIIGSLFLPLKIIASYGITMQIIDLIWNVSSVYYYTYQPKIIQARAQSNSQIIKTIYLKSCWVQLSTFITGGTAVIFFGNWGLEWIKSQTLFLPGPFILVALIVFFLALIYGTSEAVILTKNEVPFYKASLITGIATIILLFVFLRYTDLGIWSLILAPGIAQALYSNWKWPAVVARDLKIRGHDIYRSIYLFNGISRLKKHSL
jgi:O-antigen/teichoic acid export membrane protein